MTEIPSDYGNEVHQSTIRPVRPNGSDRHREEIPAAFLAGVIASFLPIVLLCAVGAALIAVVITAIQPRSYSSLGSFVPQSRRATGGVSSLAAQFGFSSVGAESGQSPTFYVDLLRTREMMRRVATASYALKANGNAPSGNLARTLGKDRPDTPEGIDDAIGYLRKAMTPGYSAQTGIVTVTVTTYNANLSALIASEFLKAVDDFNRENQHAQAADQRAFAEERLKEFRDELRGAETAFQEYLQRNKDFATSSEAGFQRERLAREVALRQQLYITVTQAFEQARMEEAKDSPQITIIERPEAALRPNPKGYVERGALGALIGALISVLFVLVREIIRQGRATGAPWYSDWAVGRRTARG